MKTDQFARAPRPHSAFQFDRILIGDSRTLLGGVPNTSVDLSFWSPPYFVGKSYERDWSFSDWEELMRSVIFEHSRILKPGCFLAITSQIFFASRTRKFRDSKQTMCKEKYTQ